MEIVPHNWKTWIVTRFHVKSYQSFVGKDSPPQRPKRWPLHRSLAMLHMWVSQNTHRQHCCDARQCFVDSPTQPGEDLKPTFSMLLWLLHKIRSREQLTWSRLSRQMPGFSFLYVNAGKVISIFSLETLFGIRNFLESAVTSKWNTAVTQRHCWQYYSSMFALETQWSQDLLCQHFMLRAKRLCAVTQA